MKLMNKLAIEFNTPDFDLLHDLIVESSVTISVLNSMGINKPVNLDYLFQNDRITTSELAQFLNKPLNTVYKQYREKNTNKTDMVRLINEDYQRDCQYKPCDVFELPEEYSNFLEWKESENNQLSLTVLRAAKILKVKRSHIYRAVQNGELRAFESNGGIKIMKTHFKYYLRKLIMTYEENIEMKANKIEKMKKVIQHDIL